MEQLASREVYRNPWFSVREDVVRRPDGSEGIYGVVDKPDFALVIPVEDDGSVWLVNQHRYPLGRTSWEFPSGGWPPGATGTPGELAAAELREETGLLAKLITPIGHLCATPGICSQEFDVFAATGLTQGATAREITEQDMEHRRFSGSELKAMIESGEIFDGPTVAGYALWQLLD